MAEVFYANEINDSSSFGLAFQEINLCFMMSFRCVEFQSQILWRNERADAI